MQVIVSGWCYVAKEDLGEEISRLRSRLTFRTPKYEDQPARTVPVFAETERHLAVPRHWGVCRYGHLGVDDRTTLGQPAVFPRRPDPFHRAVLEPERQAVFMRELVEAAREHHTFNAEAPTGSGKTVCALNMAAELGRKTLVLVHLERLARQWLEEAHEKLGLPWSQLGMLQQDRADFEGKALVAGLLHSAALRRYPREFYRAFGTVIFDEVHKLGAPMFSRTVYRFPARYKVGLSATMQRKDKGSKVYYWHLGPVRVTSSSAALPINVYVLQYRTRRSLWGRTHGARMMCLSRDPVRNRVLSRIIKQMYDRGRQGLIVSDRIEHLHRLMELTAERGVPKSDMGLFVGGTAQTELNRIKRESRLIFATYGMIKEGIDIPRLDAGLDATPRSDATQLIGRLRRPLPNKRTPLWVTILDLHCKVSNRYFRKRLQDYRKSGARMINYGSA